MDSHALHHLMEAADRCVLCGLCSSHCPTYQLHRQEGESPRGRVMMATKLLKGELAADLALEEHLDHCLLCRACERACPSEVPYGEILDRAREQLPPPSLSARLLEWIALRPAAIRALARVTRIWNQFRLPLPALGKAAAAPLADGVQPIAGRYPAAGKPTGRIGLFLGCMANPFDQRTHHDAIQLLAQLGYEVIIPKEQQCCGALPQHHGNPTQTAALAEQNRNAFDGQSLDAILFTSTGCGIQLVEKSALPAPVMEICHFLLSNPNWKKLNFRPSSQKVALHHPCSLRNTLQGDRAVEQLLEQIPQQKITLLGSNAQCCGAAGSHRLRHPESADQFRQPKIDSLIESRAEVLLTTNYGCALHLAEGAILQNHSVEVLHPVSLLSRQLITP